MPFGMRGGSSTPLPSFTPPRHTGKPMPLSSSAVAEKIALSRGLRTDSWLRKRMRASFVPLRVGSTARAIYVPVLRPLHPASRQSTPLRASDRQGQYSFTSILVALAGTAAFWVAFLLVAFTLFRPWLPEKRSLPFMDDSTLVVPLDYVERVWQWELAAGHYPSRRQINFDWPTLGSQRIENPAVPRRTEEDERQERKVQAEINRRLRDGHYVEKRAHDGLHRPEIAPVGFRRHYLPIPGRPVFHRSRYAMLPSELPQRPRFGATLDMDLVMDHCDFGQARYVRDCLEVLRTNAGLDTGVRRGDASDWRLAYLVQPDSSPQRALDDSEVEKLEGYEESMSFLLNSTTFASLLPVRQALSLQRTHERRRVPHPTHLTADPDCHPDYPRIFHMFWAGPFTDKPYVAALSFLYTQSLGLHRRSSQGSTYDACRPQMWIWINPGPASSSPDPYARQKMTNELANNPWSAPLLHPRFKESIKFKLWNTTEQLDAIPEMFGWRDMRLFNSGGVKYGSAPVSVISLTGRH